MNKEEIRQLKYDVKKVLESYPGLCVQYEIGIPIKLSGNLVIKDTGGNVQGEFDVEVRIPAGYPKGFPVLYETSSKIKRIDDRHIDKNGACCVEITQRIRQIIRNGITLQDFFKNYVHKFFCWQLLYEIDPKSVSQWEHKEDGIKQFYFELLGTRDHKIICCFIEAALNNHLPNRKGACICGSGKITKKCHGGIFFDLQQIGNVQLMHDLKIFNQ